MTTYLSPDDLAHLRQVIGDIDDARLTAILALNPSFEEIEEAALWADGRAPSKGNSEWPLAGKVGEIFEILTADSDGETQTH